MIFAFDHEHQVGDICSADRCAHARRAPVLAGDEVFEDIPMRVVRKATETEYLAQPIPDGWCIPPLVYGCAYLYEIQTDSEGVGLWERQS
jgi:hypothetical protein